MQDKSIKNRIIKNKDYNNEKRTSVNKIIINNNKKKHKIKPINIDST